ncbi:MAG: anthranilate synthase component I family protein [Candidatus Obscuribacterales bacterium]
MNIKNKLDECIDRLISHFEPLMVFEKDESYSLLILEAREIISIEANETKEGKCPFEYLRDYQERNRTQLLAGFLGYGLTAGTAGIEKQKENPLSLPDAAFFAVSIAIRVDRSTGELTIAGGDRALEKEIAEALEREAPAESLSEDLSAAPEPAPVMEKAEFLRRVKIARALIESGEAFQIVLSQRFTMPFEASALAAYRLLRRESGAAYNYYLRMPGFEYLGASPETLATVRGRRLALKALAGTRPRGRCEDEDRRREANLVSCPKERAEHMMLVDLGRNDVGAVSVAGSVQVGELARVMRLPNVMHLATSIEGELEGHVTAHDAIKSCFPRGTVSGAPKKRAMEILSTLETEQRGIYAGGVGFFELGGDADFAIAIRSALIKDNRAHINAGAGIVHDSIAEHEYRETLNKARAIIDPLRRAACRF